MRRLAARNRFKKDLKRLVKRDYDRALLDALRHAAPLPEARRDHPLRGERKGWRECHIEPDWLLIYKTTDEEVLLARTGTHADLFDN